ncbi:hypothetical protein GCM10007939_08350 [Amylibacter marinus]|uniref:Dipeptidylpeptidase IV N-terminal domain-containing protein n=1 Tax=Amylibacter marinus TaxID=1475483 RepID=A0ABQ5VTG4_9RHOB|nr:hypothetical protein GCM10007939_08350 [Amylibacter marinus]
MSLSQRYSLSKDETTLRFVATLSLRGESPPVFIKPSGFIHTLYYDFLDPSIEYVYVSWLPDGTIYRVSVGGTQSEIIIHRKSKLFLES